LADQHVHGTQNRAAKVDRSSLAFLVVMALFVWLVKYQPFAMAFRVIDDDARQHVYWTYTFRDPDLFRADLLTDFISSPKIAPLGYQALYNLGARLLDPLVFSQLLTLFLVIGCLPPLFRIGQELGGRQGGVCVACLFVVFYFMYDFSGGLPRSFAFPLLIACAALLRRHTFGYFTVLLPLQSLLYPPILLNTVALAVVTWGRGWQYAPWAQIWRQALALGVGVGIAGGILLSVYTLSPHAAYGRLVTRSEARAMPEFSAYGRIPFFAQNPVLTLLNSRAGIVATQLAWLAALLIVMYLVCRPTRLRIPSVVKDLLWTSIALFVLAHLVLFRLHLPARYVMYTFPLAAMLLLATNVERTSTAIGMHWPALLHTLRVLYARPGLRWVTVALLALTSLAIQTRYGVLSGQRVESDALQLYRYLQTLPKDVLIAGHPFEMDNIPLFAIRRVFVNHELSLPYFTGYYAEVRQRLFALLAAYYAADVEEVQRFVRHYGIDYILIDRRHFAPPFLCGSIYREPFNSFIKRRLDDRQRFALLVAPALQRVYTSGPYTLVSFVERKRGRYGSSAH
jgi:hypothetical protein